MRVFAENFHAITEEVIAIAMTAQGYRANQNAGGMILVNLPMERPVKSAVGQLSMFSLEEPLASPSVSPASEKAWLTRVATSPLRILPLLTSIGPSGWSGRTSPACCHREADGTLVPSSEGWGNSGMGGPTESWTLSTSDWPNDASVCSLSQILEAGTVPRRFYLTPRACAGILRRAEKRGKVLPTPLRSALIAVAETAKGSDSFQPWPAVSVAARKTAGCERPILTVTEPTSLKSSEP
ncbi:MAG: hypothetical protein RL042_1959 [Nitrospirota bacterium]|jgi:hypothetical protein